jgi:hypothetical protein
LVVSCPPYVAFAAVSAASAAATGPIFTPLPSNYVHFEAHRLTDAHRISKPLTLVFIGIEMFIHNGASTIVVSGS